MGTGGEERYFANPDLRCASSQLGSGRDFHYTLRDEPRSHRSSRSSRQQQQQQQDGYHHGSGSGSGSGGGRSRPRGHYQIAQQGNGPKSSPYHRSSSSSGAAATAAAAAAIRRYPPQQEFGDVSFFRPVRQTVSHPQSHLSALDCPPQPTPAKYPPAGSRTADIMDMEMTRQPPTQFAVMGCDGIIQTGSAAGWAPPPPPPQPGAYCPYQSTLGRKHRGQPQISAAADDPFSYTQQSYRDDTMLGSGGYGSSSRALASSAADSYATLRKPVRSGRASQQQQQQQQQQQSAASAAGSQEAALDYTSIRVAPQYSPHGEEAAAAAYFDFYHFRGHHDPAAAAMAAGQALVPFHSSRAALAKPLSKSTDRNLDNMGLEEDYLVYNRAGGPEALAPLIPREPPDGKEKPEPCIKAGMHKLETLSRKNSKSDLLAQEETSLGGGDNVSLVSAGSTLTGPGGPGGSAATVLTKAESVASNAKRDSLPGGGGAAMANSSLFLDDVRGAGPTVLQQGQEPKDLELPTTADWKTVPSSPGPRCPAGLTTSGGASSAAAMGPFGSAPSPKTSGPTALVGRMAAVNTAPNRQAQATYAQTQATAASYDGQNKATYDSTPVTATTAPAAAPAVAAASAVASGSTSVAVSGGGAATTLLLWHDKMKRFVVGGTAKFFGVDAETEETSRLIWNERRMRLAIKRFGGVREEYQYGDGSSRMRSDQHITSEMEGDIMVLKIKKPPMNKDSISSLTGQGISWLLNSLMTRKVPMHQIVAEHELSRSYQPSMTGIAAYYQAENGGGLAVCPPPFPRDSATHHVHGESAADEVFFTKPSCDGDDLGLSNPNRRVTAYSSDPYARSSWQIPRPDESHPRMGSDVGASRIWNRLLDAAFDNSDRRKHGMGVLGRLLSRRRARRRPPESNRKRKLGGNSNDHRPYFTYWITTVQILVLLISIAVYGAGPVGVDLYKKTGMVLVTNMELEPVGHLEPANFWIGPSAIALIHLGAKYAPCMRWDDTLDREIREERLKERDTACCIRKDRAGCVQSPKTECTKLGDGDDSVSTPRSNWRRPSEWYSKYPNENRRFSGPVCGLDPDYCEAPASVAPYIWPDDITKWPICRRKTDVKNLEGSGHAAEHMICEIIGHPCCIGIRGQCKIATREYCMFVGGTFHDEAALCSQVSCLGDICGLLPFRDKDVPDQFYRTWTPLFLHAGVLHLVITVVLQYWLMRDLEKMAGAVRIAIIYLGAGMVGNLASAIFVPYRAEVGPAGAHFGLLACCMVEVIHGWNMLKYPEMAILKLVGVTSVLFLTGLLPWVDNYAHLFGFIFGFLLSYALLPFVTFGGTYERRKKVILVWICLASVVFLFVGLLLLFYVTPIHDCEICKYFNCIPITKDFCADQNIDLTVSI